MSRAIKKIGVIGHFGFGETLINGQTVKTKTVTEALEKRYSEQQVIKKDTHGMLNATLLLPLRVFDVLRQCENIVIFPAQRGLRIIVPLLSAMNRLFSRKLHYCVVGGWLAELLRERPALVKRLKRFSGLYVETSTVKNALEAMGFENIFIVPNCKELEQVRSDDLPQRYDQPYRLCTFSRVMREKGIKDAVQAVEKINRKYGKTVFTLDIFGQIDTQQEEWFRSLSRGFSDAVRYCGVVPFDQSTEALKDCFAMLFPTHFYTEGIPGTIIDAYAAGVPVIAARWESFHDIIDDGFTGIGYPFDEEEGLFHTLAAVCDDPEAILRMKPSCLARAACYLPENALLPLFQQLGD